MKLTRSKLKDLIKECIVEVLAEGLGSGTLTEVKSANPSKKLPQPRRNKALDNIKFDKRVAQTAASMTEDPIMQSIFSDTAKTTLQEQLQHAHTSPTVPHGADAATRAAAMSAPEDLFEGASNWAELAFSQTPNK